MDKFRNKYRIQSHRMPHWNYAGNGVYFITFVTQHRECILGKIVDGKMILSDFGKIVDEEWHKSFQIRKELFLDEYVIMPNHLHAIVILDKTNDEILDDCRIADNRAIIGTHGQTHGQTHVETHGRASLQQQQRANENAHNPSTNETPSIKRNMPIRKPKSLSSFVAGFKSAVNSKIDDWIDLHVETHGRASLHGRAYQRANQKYNKQNPFFQPNYHDHIVRNAKEYERIKNYIINNPINWGRDTLRTSLL